MTTEHKLLSIFIHLIGGTKEMRPNNIQTKARSGACLRLLTITAFIPRENKVNIAGIGPEEHKDRKSNFSGDILVLSL
jgi:hypothetical protein